MTDRPAEPIAEPAESKEPRRHGACVGSWTSGTHRRWHVTERMRGTFARSFALPEATDEAGIEASFANGVLTVRVPKAAKPEPKKIVVKTK
jgi:HSP20 family molecular chaperone IbpA